MNRRDIIKGGIVFAAATPAAALAPALEEDPRMTIRRLSHQISELLESVPEYQQLVIQAKSVGPWAIYTQFAV